jgi:hypothetical protein
MERRGISFRNFVTTLLCTLTRGTAWGRVEGAFSGLIVGRNNYFRPSIFISMWVQGILRVSSKFQKNKKRTETTFLSTQLFLISLSPFPFSPLPHDRLCTTTRPHILHLLISRHCCSLITMSYHTIMGLPLPTVTKEGR